jgi:hypothetical protein
MSSPSVPAGKASMTAWAFTWLKPGMHFNIEILMAFRTAFSLVIPGFGVSRGSRLVPVVALYLQLALLSA